MTQGLGFKSLSSPMVTVGSLCMTVYVICRFPATASPKPVQKKNGWVASRGASGVKTALNIIRMTHCGAKVFLEYLL